MIFLVFYTNATTKGDLEATIYLLLCLWLFSRLRDHGGGGVVAISLGYLLLGFKK